MKVGGIATFPFLLLILCTVGGCIRGTRPAPSLTYLDVDPGRAVQMSRVSEEVLLVRRLEIKGHFADRRFSYQTEPGTYKSDYHIRFVASPADLLTHRLEVWLSESQLFKSVVESGTRAQYRYILEGQILELFGDYTHPDRASASIKADFVLVDDLNGEGEIVFEKQYRQSEPIDSSDTTALAAGWSQGLRKILLDLVSELQSHLAESAG